jgi:large subunit ribosomal protein L13
LYSGGLKVTVAQDMLKKNPERMIELAVHGMLPKTRLGSSLKTKLKVYAGSDHPHGAQQPEAWQLRG